jgi:NDP-sugar pyrophosphorylase family protein
MSRLPVPTRAVVLAGGLGTRLAPYTTVFPKPLMPIGGRPVMELVLRRLRREGVQRATLAVSYLEELIRAFFGDGRKLGIDIDYYREEKPLGTAGVLSVLEDLPDPCLVVNGDVLTTLDLGSMCALHAERSAALTVAVHRRTVPIDYGVLETGSDGDVLAYREKPSLSYEVSMGVNLVSTRARSAMVRGERCDIPDLVQLLLRQGERVAGFLTAEYWRDIGRADDYEQANAEFATVAPQFGL